LAESLVRILMGLNRDLEGLVRATAAMRPYFGEKYEGRKISAFADPIEQGIDVQVRSAEEVRTVIFQVRHHDF
jgi:hypothetical protein